MVEEDKMKVWCIIHTGLDWSNITSSVKEICSSEEIAKSHLKEYPLDTQPSNKEPFPWRNKRGYIEIELDQPIILPKDKFVILEAK